MIENIEALKSTAQQQAQTLAETIRNYSKSQVEYWKQVPSLALEADGRTGYDDNHARAYYHRIWPVTQSQGGYTAFVSLDSGEIVNYFLWGAEKHSKKESDNRIKKSLLADDHLVLELASSLNKLDAVTLVNFLKEQAQAPYWKHYDPKQVIAWRAELRDKLGLEVPA